MKDKKIYLGVGLALLLLMTISLSYAYFSTNVSGNDNAKDVIVTAGTLSLVYTDGPEIKVENIRPGKTITKEVSVKNTGTLDTAYNIVWQELSNEITNNEMLVSATCQRLNASGVVEGTCNAITESAISSNIIQKNISIESGITHKYTFTITFKEISANQNYNQGKKFSGVLGIEEYKSNSAASIADDSWKTIIEKVKAGHGSDYEVGSTKEIDMGNYGIHTVRVANTSTPTECSKSNFSQTACGFVLEFTDVIADHTMNDKNKSVGGWPASSMYTFVNNDIYNALPSELRSAIIDTATVSGHESDTTKIIRSTDKLYLLTSKEIYTDWSSGEDTARKLTRTLDYYTAQGVTLSNYSGAIKKNGTSADLWWFRSAYVIYAGSFLCVGKNGYWGYNTALASYGVSPAFRIG